MELGVWGIEHVVSRDLGMNNENEQTQGLRPNFQGGNYSSYDCQKISPLLERWSREQGVKGKLKT